MSPTVVVTPMRRRWRLGCRTGGPRPHHSLGARLGGGGQRDWPLLFAASFGLRQRWPRRTPERRPRGRAARSVPGFAARHELASIAPVLVHAEAQTRGGRRDFVRLALEFAWTHLMVRLYLCGRTPGEVAASFVGVPCGQPVGSTLAIYAKGSDRRRSLRAHVRLGHRRMVPSLICIGPRPPLRTAVITRANGGFRYYVAKGVTMWIGGLSRSMFRAGRVGRHWAHPGKCDCLDRIETAKATDGYVTLGGRRRQRRNQRRMKAA